MSKVHYFCDWVLGDTMFVIFDHLDVYEFSKHILRLSIVTLYYAILIKSSHVSTFTLEKKNDTNLNDQTLCVFS